MKKQLYVIIAIGLIMLWWVRSCTDKPNESTTWRYIDTLTPKISKNNKDLEILKDSVPYYREKAKQALLRKNYYKQLYKSIYDSLYFASDSICKSRLQLANEIKLKQDSAHEAENQANIELIANAFNQIDEYAENQKLYELRYKVDSTYIDQLEDSIPKVYKQRFWKGYKKGFKHGTLTGIAIDESLRAGIRSVKP